MFYVQYFNEPEKDGKTQTLLCFAKSHVQNSFKNGK